MKKKTANTALPPRLKKPLTPKKLRALCDEENHITVVIAVELGELACCSRDGTYEGLNEIADEQICDDRFCLLDLSYRPVGVEGDKVLIEVSADASDALGDMEDDSAEWCDEATLLAAEHSCGRLVSATELKDAVAQYAIFSTRELNKLLKDKERTFEDNGGRGVELADDIDSMRMALAVRRVKKEKTKG
jgi:hypothetical protein